MLRKFIALVILFTVIDQSSGRFRAKPTNLTIDDISNWVPSNDECVRRIYRGCNHPTYFTDQELENVRQYLKFSFTVLADIKPDKPLCPKLHVRQDWKCLSPLQKKSVTNVWKQMYENGVIQKLTDLHVKVWPAWHKTPEFLPAHRWFTNECEKAMRAIDPKVTLPYWDPYTYGSQPERSSVWDTLGHSGNYSNGYTVPDGIYAEWGLIPSMKRHWLYNKKILPWWTQEFTTSAIQTSKSLPEILFYTFGLHFGPHLNIGGYQGQYSYKNAPYDCLFYMHHTAGSDVGIFRWQLLDKKYLTPLSYNQPLTKFNSHNGKLEHSNILTDRITGAPGVTVRETFWMGFGDFCSIPDQLIRPISNLWKGIRDPIPTAAKRLSLPIIVKYFPAFLKKNISAISHTFEEVGECNKACHPIPKPTFMRDTEAGRLQFEAYRFDNGLDLTPAILASEKRLYQMWLDFNSAKTCSPYVTTYY